ncbi:hypothetical protein GF402_03420 [Candidatus Fermentibacteria bacterium]|nr:hypothetical protein [Candidatus Fermentibacteria bacterium]
MHWKVVVKAENPSRRALDTLGEITGLSRSEALLALRKGELVAGDRFAKSRAENLARSLREDLGLDATAEQVEDRSSESRSPLFRVVLAGYRPGYRARVREKLERLSNLPPEQVVLWLSKIPFVLRDNVDHQTARSIKRIMTEAGAIVDFGPSGVGEEGKPITVGPTITTRPGPTVRNEPAVKTEEPTEEEPEAPPVPPMVSEGPGAYRSVPPPVLNFLPPPEPDVEAPPLVEFEPERSEPPPRMSYRSPPRELSLPPVLGPTEVCSGAPPMLLVTEPVGDDGGTGEEERPFLLILHRPSNILSRSVTKAVRDCLKITDKQAEALLGSYPVRLASFPSREEAQELAQILENHGATVSVLESTTDLYPSFPSQRAAEGSLGFREWLRRG